MGENLKTKQRSVNEEGQVKLTEQQFERIFNDTHPSEHVSSSKGAIVRRFPDTRESNEKSYEQHLVFSLKNRGTVAKLAEQKQGMIFSDVSRISSSVV